MAREPWKKRLWWRNLSWCKSKVLPWVDGYLYEADFREKLVQERRRAERSGKPLVVMLVDCGHNASGRQEAARLVGERVRPALRQTDVCGELSGAFAAILTEIDAVKVPEAQHAVAARVKERIDLQLPADQTGASISFRVYPESGGREGAFDMMFFPELEEGGGQAAELVVKRVLDLVGGVVTLVLLAPVFLVLPLAIRLSSDGPVFFRQERFGLNGTRFMLFKFRTMFVDNRDDIHREFVKKLIQGEMGEEQKVFKITHDPRVTPIGRMLRKYSLDELPQLFNVVLGQMSLVGPRPPIAYEVEDYRSWQRNRLIGKKPGITGAWQVSGRSSTNFDEMVRLDLRYLKGWSIMLDLKILLQTPLAVLRGRGAY